MPQKINFVFFLLGYFIYLPFEFASVLVRAFRCVRFRSLFLTIIFVNVCN